MSQIRSSPTRTARRPQPTWEVAHLFPAQGDWTEEEYLALDTNHLVELSNGVLEVLPMPTTSHQLVVGFLYRLLLDFTAIAGLGMVVMAPLPIRLWRGKIREPDVLFSLQEHSEQIREEFWSGADLVMEVVSGSGEDRRRDLVEKRREYARAGIAEYWIVDPREENITVLRLSAKRYIVHGIFGKGEMASSHLLTGFTVDVTETFSRKAPRAASKKARKSGRRAQQ
jgi:Uma2 family endonuclease